MIKVDLNCDLGEGFGNYNMGMDKEIIPLITSANIACGAHASDPVIMSKTVAMCKTYDVAVGAHPGFFDLMGFGRRNVSVTPLEAKAYVQYQIGALQAFCKANGIRLAHVKPHGALYNMAGRDFDLALAICEAIKEIDTEIILLGLSGSKMLEAANQLGLRAAHEVFADRGYEEDGSLVKRGKAGAMITDEDEAVKRVVRMVKEGKVKAVSGRDIEIKADSVCVHGDGEKALAFVQKIGKALQNAGIELRSLNEIV